MFLVIKNKKTCIPSCLWLPGIVVSAGGVARVMGPGISRRKKGRTDVYSVPSAAAENVVETTVEDRDRDGSRGRDRGRIDTCRDTGIDINTDSGSDRGRDCVHVMAGFICLR